MNSTENRVMTLDEIRQSLAYWQPLLRLQDWKIDVRFVRGNHLFDKAHHIGAMQGEMLAQVYMREQTKFALLKILDPADFTDPFTEQDHEHDLVHELIHLLTGPCEPEESKKELHDRMELSINLMADALVEQRRRWWRLQDAAAK
jgi:hypothetical protein